MPMMDGTGMLGAGMMGGHHLFMGYGWLFQLLIIVLLVLIFWWLLKGQGFGYTAHEEPLAIVKRRYASGELTKKEYEQLKKDLAE